MSESQFEELKLRLLSLVKDSSDKRLVDTIMDGINRIECKVKQK